MAAEWLQDAIVTMVTLGAGVMVTRRVLGFVSVKDHAQAGCERCPVADQTRRVGQTLGASPSGALPATSTVHPVTLIRRPTSSRSTSV